MNAHYLYKRQDGSYFLSTGDPVMMRVHEVMRGENISTCIGAWRYKNVSINAPRPARIRFFIQKNLYLFLSVEGAHAEFGRKNLYHNTRFGREISRLAREYFFYSEKTSDQDIFNSLWREFKKTDVQ